MTIKDEARMSERLVAISSATGRVRYEDVQAIVILTITADGNVLRYVSVSSEAAAYALIGSVQTISDDAKKLLPNAD